jgi:ribonuclease E
VYLPSGGSLVIDRTEAMVVIDVNTGKYVGKGGNLEETVTRNNLEAAEEIARQLRLRDLGGIIVVDFIDMVLESNRDLVVRRLVECMARDRTKHQVAEVTSLGLVQMTRKRVGQGLLESFSEPCERCNGRGVLVSTEPVDSPRGGSDNGGDRGRDRERGSGRGRGRKDGDDRPAGKGDDEPAKGRGRGGRGRGEDDGDKAADKPTDKAADKPTDKAAEKTADAPGGSGSGSDDDTGSAAPRRRRRSGRGSGAATVAPGDEMAELLSDAAPATETPTADSPVPAQEDLPVVPPVVASVTDPEPVDDTATAARVDPESSPPAVVPDRPDAPAAEPTTAPDEPPGEAAPRRRRRATSRPAGPPVVT